MTIPNCRLPIVLIALAACALGANVSTTAFNRQSTIGNRQWLDSVEALQNVACLKSKNYGSAMGTGGW